MFYQNVPTLTSELMLQIEDFITSGVPRDKALGAAGVTREAYAHYKALATSAPPVEPYASWLRSLKAAEAKAEASLVTTIRESKDWRAAAWWLERTNPEKYGQKLQISVQQELDKVYGVAEKILPAHLFDALIDAIADGDSPEQGEASPAAPPQLSN